MRGNYLSNGDYDFVSVSLKKDVANQIDKICTDAKKYGIFIDKSGLIRIMVFNATIVEYSIKQLINDKSGKEKQPSQETQPPT